MACTTRVPGRRHPRPISDHSCSDKPKAAQLDGAWRVDETYIKVTSFDPLTTSTGCLISPRRGNAESTPWVQVVIAVTCA
jgi:hypothetical protein